MMKRFQLKLKKKNWKTRACLVGLRMMSFFNYFSSYGYVEFDKCTFCKNNTDMTCVNCSLFVCYVDATRFVLVELLFADGLYMS